MELHSPSGSCLEEVTLHRAGYVAELREFFATAHVPFGSPDHLDALNQRLATGESFRDDMISMARSMIFREGGALPPAELLLIFASAVAGDDTSRQPPDYPQKLRDLLGFLTRVTRMPINHHRPLNPEKSSEPTTGAAVTRPAAVPAAIPAPVPAPRPARVESRPPAAVAAAPEPRSAATVVPIRTNRPFADALARAQAESGQTRPVPAAPPRRSSPADRHRWWWIPAAGVTMALAAGFVSHSYLHPASAASHTVSPADTPVASAAPNPAALKPSPAIPASALPARSSAAASSSFRRFGERPAVAPRFANPAPPAASAPEPTPPPDPVATDDVSTPAAIGTPLVERPGQPAPEATVITSSIRTPSRAYVNTSRSGPRSLLDVSSGVMSANLISAPAPAYPKLAGVMHLEGPVIMQAIISRSGAVSAVHVLRGHYLLRGAAVDAVRRWRYHPFVAGGRPVDVSTVVTVNFRRQH